MHFQQKLIAERAGVSYATVSRALTGSARVNPETMKKIRAAMKDLGDGNCDDFLIGKNALSKHILILMDDISNDFCARTVKGINEVLAPRGYSIVLVSSDYDSGRELSAIRKAAESGYGAIIMPASCEDSRVYESVENAKIPIIMINHRVRSADIDTVRADSYRGGYLAAQHLLEKGHTRIAHLAGPKKNISVQECCRGFSDALSDSGIGFSKEDRVYGDFTTTSGRYFADWLLKKRGTHSAALIANDLMAVGTARRLMQNGVSIPRDLGLICVGDSSLVNESGLNITAVNTNPGLLGSCAAFAFLRHRGNMPDECSQTVLAPTLNIRGSVRNISAPDKTSEG